MFDTRTRLFFLACLEDAAGAGTALKSAAPAPGSDQQKNQLRLPAPAPQHCKKGLPDSGYCHGI